MSTTKIGIEYKSIDGFWGWELKINGEPFDGPYASLGTALGMAYLETVGGPPFREGQELYSTIKSYQEWVEAQNADDLEGMALSDYDEARTDWWQSIATLAESAVGL